MTNSREKGKRIERSWRPIPGWEGMYSVSSDGRVYSVRSDKILRPGLSSGGYHLFVLYQGARRETVYAHKLVATLWNGPPRAGQEVDHVNCVKTDNWPGNLEWVSRQENRRRSAANGLDPRGSRHHKAILNEECVKVIRLLRRKGAASGRLLARLHGVGDSTISAVVTRDNWRRLDA